MDLFSKKLLLVLACEAVFMGSCTKEEKGLTKERVQRMADSIYKVKAQKLRQQAAEDLDRRMSIELKPKIDSLLGRTASVSVPPVLNTDTAVEVDLPDSTNSKDSLK